MGNNGAWLYSIIKVIVNLFSLVYQQQQAYGAVPQGGYAPPPPAGYAGPPQVGAYPAPSYQYNVTVQPQQRVVVVGGCPACRVSGFILFLLFILDVFKNTFLKGRKRKNIGKCTFKEI